MTTTRRPSAGFSAGTLLNSVFLALAVALAAALLVQMGSASTELRLANRTTKLAETDRILFETSGAMRLSRGNSQTALQTADDAKSKLEEIRTHTDRLLQAALRARSATSSRPTPGTSRSVRSSAVLRTCRARLPPKPGSRIR